MTKPHARQHIRIGTGKPKTKQSHKKGIAQIDRTRIDKWFEAVREKNRVKEVWETEE